MFYHGRRTWSQSFQLIRQAFLQAEELPFGDLLSEDEIRQAFEKENACFAKDPGDIYTPAITLWAFLSQVLHAKRLRSCVAAVSRVTVLCVALGQKPPSPDTGAYCRARAKLPERVLSRLVYDLADELESRVPADWLWQGRHVKVGDGTTLVAPDTEDNQKEWPQPRSQKPGVGFPLLRMVVLFSLATAAVSGVAVGPSKGKQTGESALLRSLLDRFPPGDVFLGDCGFCSYFLLALLVARKVDVVVRQHQRRRTDLRGQTPAMVRREIWVHWLAYNLIRKTIAQAALTHEKLPCQLSFAGALAAVAASWDHATIAPRSLLAALALAQFRLIARHQVGHRPNRVEPRAIKRRPKPHRLLRQPRPQARAELCGLPSAP